MLHLKEIFTIIVHRPDIVHLQWPANPEQDLWFIRRIQRLGIPVVYTAHDVLPHDGDSTAGRLALGQLYRIADRTIVHTEADRRDLIELYGVSSETIAVVPHGSYDFEFGYQNSLDKEEARRLLRISARKRVVLFFGLIKRYKGLEYLIPAFELVSRRIPDAFLLVVGDVFRGDAEGHRDYSALLSKLRNRKDVLAVTEYVPVREVQKYFAAADLVVLPYTRTSQSGVLLAAYGIGRPVVVTSSGGLPEIVEGNETGCVVPPGDVGALANAIVALLSDPVRLAAMGERARVLGHTTYNWAQIASRTLAQYAVAADHRRRSRRSGGATSQPAESAWREDSAPAPRPQ